MNTVSAEHIAYKNDMMRKTFIGCKVVLTEGVRSLDEKHQSDVIESVQKYNHFNPDNDPHGEHDFGAFTLLDGSKFFWKFDYYDDDFVFFREDGNRVLTIMRADEY